MTRFLLLVFVIIVGWELLWTLFGVKLMFPWELKRILAEDGIKPILLDVRTPQEFSAFHIEGAVNQPEMLAGKGEIHNVFAGQKIVFICMSGHRSPIAAYVFHKKGMKNVYHLSGGMLGYKLLGGETEGGAQ